MTEREAFILTCIELTRMDGLLSPEEMQTCLNTLRNLGYTDEEFDQVENKLDEYSEEDLIAAIERMPKVMKKNLLLAMQQIAGSDSIDESEIEFINSIMNIIKNA